MAIMLVVLKGRHGDWNPWFREGCYDDDDSLGDEIRGWSDYKAALEIVRLMIRRHDERVRKEEQEYLEGGSQ